MFTFSNHAKKIKEAIVTNGIKTVLTKSCPCLMQKSMGLLEKRLLSAGYPGHLVESKKRLILIRNLGQVKGVTEDKIKRFACAPYLHSISSSLGKVTGLDSP